MLRDPESIGRFEVIRRLGEGGMGVLYLARDPLLGRTLAVKMLSVLTSDLRERFSREARAAATLKHPNKPYIRNTRFSAFNKLSSL